MRLGGRVASLVAALESDSGSPYLVILDEFDVVEETSTRQDVAALIKQLSDGQYRTKLVVVGIGNNYKNLMGEHSSISRCLATYRIDPMTKLEMYEIIEIGERMLEVKFTEKMKATIAYLADGYPHIVHSCCLYLIVAKDSPVNRLAEVDEHNATALLGPHGWHSG